MHVKSFNLEKYLTVPHWEKEIGKCSFSNVSRCLSFAVVCGWLPGRYVVCFLMFLGMMITYILRFCLSIAITEMVRHHRKSDLNGSLPEDTCPYDEDYLAATSSQAGVSILDCFLT